MNIVISFEAMVPCIEVALPDETQSYEVLEQLKRAIGEGKQQVVNIILESEMAAQVPRHGVIKFDSEAVDLLNADFEGMYWLYVQEQPIRLRASAVGLKFISNVVHMLLLDCTLDEQP